MGCRRIEAPKIDESEVTLTAQYSGGDGRERFGAMEDFEGEGIEGRRCGGLKQLSTDDGPVAREFDFEA